MGSGVVGDIAAEVRDILVFHLGAEEAQITDDARLIEDLGADSLDVLKFVRSCEEKFDIDIPTHAAAKFVTFSDAVEFIKLQVAEAAEPGLTQQSPRLRVAFGQAKRRRVGRPGIINQLQRFSLDHQFRLVVSLIALSAALFPCWARRVKSIRRKCKQRRMRARASYTSAR
jgi:acyl carrier protein